MSPSAVAAGGLVLDITGAIVIALGLVLKTPEVAVAEATPRYDFNVVLDANIARQTADAQVGAFLLVAGFSLQLAGALGWHESSWLAVGLALGTATLAAAAALAFLHYRWRPHVVKRVLIARLRASNPDMWQSALILFGAQLGQPYGGDPETIEGYTGRLLGPGRWETLTAGMDHGNLYSYEHPRSEVAGTREYEEAHREAGV